MHFVDRVAVFFEYFSLLIGESVGEFIAILAHQGEQVFERTVVVRKRFVRIDVAVHRSSSTVIRRSPR